MKRVQQLTAIMEREGNGYVGLCPEFDVAGQGDSIETARANLQKAVELFFETADPTEIERRPHSEVFVTRLEVEVRQSQLPRFLFEIESENTLQF